MRIIIGSLMHESNTFSTIKTDLTSFQKTQLLFENEIINYHTDRRTEIGGMLQALKDRSVEIIPTISAVALPSGIVYRKTFEFLKEKLLSSIRKNKNIDGVLLAFHGAMVVEELDDPEGTLLEQIRKIIGDKVYVGVTLDLHANLSELMIKNIDFIIGYRTHPHTDQWDVGKKAADTILDLIKKQITTSVIMKKLPLIAPAESSFETREKLMKKIQELENKDKIITASFFLGYPWADIPIIGTSTVVVTENNSELAEEKAEEIARFIWTLKDKLPLPTLPVNYAIEEAIKTRGGPVVLCDMGDCIFGGASGDVTTLLSKIIEQEVKNVALAVLVDPEAVREVLQRGEGREMTLWIGGKLDRTNGKPLKVKGKVKLITSKNIKEDSVHTGYEINMGQLVVLEIKNNIEIVLAENGGRVYEPAFLRNLGIRPETKKIIIIKDALCPAITYKDIAKKVIFVESPGWCNQNYKSLDYKRIPRPIFPLDEIEDEQLKILLKKYKKEV